MQRVQRGRTARRELNEQKEAATRIQVLLLIVLSVKNTIPRPILDLFLAQNCLTKGSRDPHSEHPLWQVRAVRSNATISVADYSQQRSKTGALSTGRLAQSLTKQVSPLLSKRAPQRSAFLGRLRSLERSQTGALSTGIKEEQLARITPAGNLQIDPWIDLIGRC